MQPSPDSDRQPSLHYLHYPLQMKTHPFYSDLIFQYQNLHFSDLYFSVFLRKENFRLRRDIILPCLALGISTFVMLSTESILSISFTSSLSRYGGDLAVGAMTIITSVSQLVTMPVQGICQGGQLITSYNFGTNNKKRVKEAFLPSLKPASFLRPCAGLFCFLHACEN